MEHKYLTTIKHALLLASHTQKAPIYEELLKKMDGFVLVEKSKLLQILGSAVAINEIPKTKINLVESNFIISEVKAMIEAQEQVG